MYLLSDALAVPAIGGVPRLCKALVRAQRLCQVGIEPTTLGQASQEVVQLHRQAVFYTAASCPLRRPSVVALTYRQITCTEYDASRGETDSSSKTQNITTDTQTKLRSELLQICYSSFQTTLASYFGDLAFDWQS